MQHLDQKANTGDKSNIFWSRVWGGFFSKGDKTSKIIGVGYKMWPLPISLGKTYIMQLSPLSKNMAIFSDFIATKSETLILKSVNDQNQPKMQIFLYSAFR